MDTAGKKRRKPRKIAMFLSHILGVANGPTKTMSLAEFSSNLTDSTASFFSSYMHLEASISSLCWLGVSIFFKAEQV